MADHWVRLVDQEGRPCRAAPAILHWGAVPVIAFAVVTLGTGEAVNLAEVPSVIPCQVVPGVSAQRAVLVAYLVPVADSFAAFPEHPAVGVPLQVGVADREHSEGFRPVAAGPR